MILHWRIVIENKVLPISTETINCFAIGICQCIRVCKNWSLTAVYGTLILKDCIIGSAGYIALLPCALPAVREVIVNLCLAHLTLLGSNEDNTIGCTCTINGTRSGILQHLDTLDVARVEIIQATLDRHAVYDIERVRVVDGTCTTYTNLGTLTRLT